MLQGSLRLFHTNCNYLSAVTKLRQFVTSIVQVTQPTLLSRRVNYRLNFDIYSFEIAVTNKPLSDINMPSSFCDALTHHRSALQLNCITLFALLLATSTSIAQEVVVGEDVDGRLTIRAVRYSGEINLDGNLDEEVYTQFAPADYFIQQLPDEGEPASERTEAWVYFDDDNLYVAARNYESVPEEDWVANEMRRDTFQLRTNDSFSVMLDTFLDRRNGVAFLVTPIGGFSDFAIANEGDRGRGVNFDWNIVWDSRVSRFDGGWTVEMQIPFRSLRYEPGESQTWGIQFRRIIRRLNEASYLTELPI